MKNKIVDLLKKSLPKVVFLASAAFIVLSLPQLHGDWIRSKVGSQVVMLLDKEGKRGGTGFAVVAPSGKVYTITNAHVCALAPEIVYAKSDAGRAIPLRIIERSKDADLCILDGLGRMTGLDIASKVSIGEELGLVGHPKLMPLTLSRGQLIGYADVVVMVSEGACPIDEGMYKTVDSLFGPVCVEVNRSGLTNIPAFGGNSGSPIVNFYGNVVGVLYAGDNSVNWGIMIPVEALREFIKEY